MPLPVIADCYRVALLWNGGVVVNVMHISKAAVGPDDVYSVLDNNVDANNWGGVSSSFSVTNVDVTPLFLNGATHRYNTGSPAKWSGGVGGQYMPAVAAGLSLRTNSRGRSYRGRMFFGPLAESAQSNGIYDETFRAAQQTAWNALVDDLDADDFKLVVASYKLETAAEVTSLSVSTFVRTQRRRQHNIAG